MRRLMWVVLLLSVAPVVRAQTPQDTGGDAAEVQQLQREIRQRWNERVRQNLGLTDQQATQLQGTESKYLAQRRDLAQRQRAVNEALRGQLQPGVAANDDSVRKLMDERERNRAALTQIERDENAEVARYLTPVQHARYQMMREQLRQRIQELRGMRQRRMEGRRLGRRRGLPQP